MNKMLEAFAVQSVDTIQDRPKKMHSRKTEIRELYLGMQNRI